MTNGNFNNQYEGHGRTALRGPLTHWKGVMFP
jgi:hypothetical protein